MQKRTSTTAVGKMSIHRSQESASNINTSAPPLSEAHEFASLPRLVQADQLVADADLLHLEEVLHRRYTFEVSALRTASPLGTWLASFIGPAKKTRIDCSTTIYFGSSSFLAFSGRAKVSAAAATNWMLSDEALPIDSPVEPSSSFQFQNVSLEGIRRPSTTVNSS